MVRFFVAQTSDAKVRAALRAEQAQFHDLVILPHMDHYQSLPKKTLGMCNYASKIEYAKNDYILRYALCVVIYRLCLHLILFDSVTYLFKCDDDTHLRIPELMTRLLGLEKRTFLLGTLVKYVIFLYFRYNTNTRVSLCFIPQMFEIYRENIFPCIFLA